MSHKLIIYDLWDEPELIRDRHYLKSRNLLLSDIENPFIVLRPIRQP